MLQKLENILAGCNRLVERLCGWCVDRQLATMKTYPHIHTVLVIGTIIAGVIGGIIAN